MVWVEGDRDRRFVEAIVMPRLPKVYDDVLVKAYSERQRHLINGTLLSMSHQGFDRLFVADLNAAPCITIRKNKLKEHYKALRDEEIIIVSKEIESWYLAGLTTEGAATLKVKCPASTDQLTKEECDRIRPARFDAELDSLLELLQYFDVETACRRNKSFAYFWQKFLT